MRAKGSMIFNPDSILVVRHGDTTIPSTKFRSWDPSPLTAEGRAEARRVAGIVCRFQPKQIVSSDLLAAKQTATVIGHECGLKPQLDPRLRTWNLGDLSGTPVKRGLSTIRAYSINYPDSPVPAGHSFNRFKQKAVDAFQDWLVPGTVIVTHTRPMQLLKGFLANGRLDDAVDVRVFNDYSRKVDTGDILQVTKGASGRWKVQPLRA